MNRVKKEMGETGIIEERRRENGFMLHHSGSCIIYGLERWRWMQETKS
jgi:hypothetical protein